VTGTNNRNRVHRIFLRHCSRCDPRPALAGRLRARHPRPRGRTAQPGEACYCIRCVITYRTAAAESVAPSCKRSSSMSCRTSASAARCSAVIACAHAQSDRPDSTHRRSKPLKSGDAFSTRSPLGNQLQDAESPVRNRPQRHGIAPWNAGHHDRDSGHPGSFLLPNTRNYYFIRKVGGHAHRSSDFVGQRSAKAQEQYCTLVACKCGQPNGMLRKIDDDVLVCNMTSCGA
jgi:hypothetical protein